MSDQPSNSQFLIYQTEDGRIKLDVRFEGETVWRVASSKNDTRASKKQGYVDS